MELNWLSSSHTAHKSAVVVTCLILQLDAVEEEKRFVLAHGLRVYHGKDMVMRA